MSGTFGLDVRPRDKQARVKDVFPHLSMTVEDEYAKKHASCFGTPAFDYDYPNLYVTNHHVIVKVTITPKFKLLFTLIHKQTRLDVKRMTNPKGNFFELINFGTLTGEDMCATVDSLSFLNAILQCFHNVV